MDHYQNLIIVIQDLLNYCPKCGSRFIDNQKARNSSGNTAICCLECGNNWTEAQMLIDKEFVIEVLIQNNFKEEALLVKGMNDSLYKDFLSRELEIGIYLH